MIFSRLKKLLGFGIVPKKACCCGEGCSSFSVDLNITDTDKIALKKVSGTVVVGKIMAITPHKDPKITKVQVTQCDLGNGETQQILCGGANIAEGQIVPVAKIGTDLGGGFVIKEREIRSEISRGMICARQEIGLTEIEAEKGGIWVLPFQLESKLGVPVNQL